MEIARKRLIGGAAGLAVAAIGGGLLLGDFARTDNFDFYKQPHASSYQSPGAMAVADSASPPVAPPSPAAPLPLVAPLPIVDSDPAVSPVPGARRDDDRVVEPEIVPEPVDGSSDEPGWRENPDRDAEGEE